MGYAKFYNNLQMHIPAAMQKSTSATITHPKMTNTPLNTNTAQLVSINTDELASLPQMYPRRRSSWYSQATVEFEHLSAMPAGQATRSEDRSFSDSYVTPSSVVDLSSVSPCEQCQPWTTFIPDSWKDVEDKTFQKPSQPDLARHDSSKQSATIKNQHIAVSKYLKGRSWLPESTSSKTSDGFVSVAYQQNQHGPSPIPITTLHALERQVSKHDNKKSALIRGLSQRYNASRTSAQATSLHHTDSTSYHHHGTLRAENGIPLQGSHQSQAQQFLHQCYRSSSPEALNSKTRDPAACSNQGVWLEIGTLRGPTPAGARLVDEIMAKSMNKQGNAEKGLKEIRKILKHENRTVIEWVEMYLSVKWHVEL